MAAYVIDLNNLPNQRTLLTMDLFDEKRTFRVEFNYREICGYWTMTITDWDTREVLLYNAPLITGESLDGVGNILKQFADFGIGQCGICPKAITTTDYPNSTNMNEFQMFWRDNE